MMLKDHFYYCISLVLFCSVVFSSACQTSRSENKQPLSIMENSSDSLDTSRYWVYVSSGQEDDQGKGIGVYGWDPASGRLTARYEQDLVTSSSYLALDQEKQRLYSINHQGLQSFIIDPNSGQIGELNSIAPTGKGGCYLSISNDGKYILAAYYSSGSIASYRLKTDGVVGEQLSTHQHEGSSVNKERQEAAHAHMILPAPDSELIFVPDLGIDKVMAYRLSADGTLTAAPQPFVSLKPGYGPRHLAFHPHRPFAYVLAELTSHVVGFNLDKTRGLTTEINDINMLPADFTEFSKAADLHITPNGKFLYASNRGHDSIAIMSIDEDSGQLTLVDIIPCGGSWPRAFAIDPTGNYLLIANKRSHAISVNRIDNSTGLFTEVAKVNTVKAPQCIRFFKRD